MSTLINPVSIWKIGSCLTKLLVIHEYLKSPHHFYTYQIIRALLFQTYHGYNLRDLASRAQSEQKEKFIQQSWDSLSFIKGGEQPAEKATNLGQI